VFHGFMARSGDDAGGGSVVRVGKLVGDVGGSAVAVRAMRSVLHPLYASEIENVAGARAKFPFDASQWEALRRLSAARPQADRRGR
jgi:predicted metalloendopeptidase